MPSRRRARVSATFAAVACALLFVARASRARAYDDAWLDALDDDDAEPRDDFHAFEFDDDDARDATGDDRLARDDDVEDDAFDAFDADEAAVMAELREAMAMKEEAAARARDAAAAAAAEAEAEETTSMEEAKEAPVEMEPAEVSDDADFFDESWVAAAPAAAVEVNAEEAAGAVDVDASPPSTERSEETSDAVDVRAEEEENVASEASMTTDDAPEEDGPVVQTSEIVEERALEVVDEDEEETEPAEKSGFMSSFFNRLVKDEPREILDESDEDESTQSDVDATVAEVTDLAPDSDPIESLPEPESTPEPAGEPVRADAAAVEPAAVPEAIDEVPKIVEEQHGERRKLLEAPNQHEPYIEPPPRRQKTVYVGGYYKRSNPWAKGPRVKSVD